MIDGCHLNRVPNPLRNDRHKLGLPSAKCCGSSLQSTSYLGGETHLNCQLNRITTYRRIDRNPGIASVSVRLGCSRLFYRPLSQSVSQSIRRSVNPIVSQSVSQSASQSLSQWVSHS